jgi:hypothetical protein
MKTMSVAQLGHGGASRAIRDAEHQPVLVSKENRPAAWIVSAERLAEVASARGAGAAAGYEHALELIAVELYKCEVLSLGQAARMSGLDLGDFIDLCGRLRVPILWESDGGLRADLNAAVAIRDAQRFDE